MVTLSDKPPENTRSSSVLKVVFGLLIVFGLVTVIYCVAVGIALSSFEIDLGEEFDQWKTHIAEAAPRDTKQITEIEIPDQFVPIFGTSGDVRTTDFLKTIFGLTDFVSVKVAFFMIPSEQMEIDQSQNNTSDYEGILCLFQLSDEDAKKTSYNDFKTKLEEGDLSLKNLQIIESTQIRRVVREEPAIFLLSRKLDDDLGGKEAWTLLGFFRGKEAPAFLLMIVNTDRMEKEQILAMIDSIQ